MSERDARGPEDHDAPLEWRAPSAVRHATVRTATSFREGWMDDYYDLGTYSRRVTTNSTDAQTWFDRGLNWLFGFNHAEAIKCFAKAAEHDPKCAMAQWGISYAAGPNYNLPWHLY